MDNKPIAVIELGSKKAKLVVGYELNGKPYVLYTLVKPYGEQVIENGEFLEKDRIIQTINDLTNLVDPTVKLKLNITDVVLVLPPYGLQVLRTRQTTGTTSEEGKISTFDIKNIYSIIRNCNTDRNNLLVDIVPQYFMLDQGRTFVNAPIGEASRTLQVAANVHALPDHIVKDYNSVVTKGNMNIKRNVVASFAANELYSTEDDIPESYFMVDIGSNTTTVSLVGKKVLYLSTYFGWGGDNITQKIVANFNINEADAEKYKITYGIDRRVLNFKAPVCVNYDFEGNEVKHYVDELNTIIENELDSFVSQLNAALEVLLKDSGKLNLLGKVPVVLVGGGSRLHGLVEYIAPNVKSEDIRTYMPKTLGARNATFVNCLGTLLVCSKYPTIFDESRPKVGALARESSFADK